MFAAVLSGVGASTLSAFRIIYLSTSLPILRLGDNKNKNVV